MLTLHIPLAVSGFLGTRGTLMLDVVFLAMFAVVPVMAWSVYLVRYRRAYLLHKRIQLSLGAVLLIAVAAFEVDMRINGWRHLAEPSPYWKPGNWNDWIEYSLLIHLFFAIPTLLLWTTVIVRALRHYQNPPIPNAHSRAHIFWARWAVFEMSMTAITGWIFYWLAFAA